MKRFSREQIRIYLLDDLQKDPKSVVREIVQFVGLDPAECEKFTFPVRNVAKSEMRYYRAFRQWIWNMLPFPGHPPRFVPFSQVRNRPPLRPEFRAFLAEHFRPHNQRLAALLGRNLDHWV